MFEALALPLFAETAEYRILAASDGPSLRLHLGMVQSFTGFCSVSRCCCSP